jgi:hypothetical protein
VTTTQELSLWDLTSGLAILYRKPLDGAVNGFASEEADQHGETFVRRIAFNSRPSNKWQFIDVGLVGTASESEQLAHLIEAAYGISLTENGRLQILLAIGILHRPAATDYLMELIASGSEPNAIAALSVLTIYKHDPNLRVRSWATLRSTRPLEV